MSASAMLLLGCITVLSPGQVVTEDVRYTRSTPGEFNSFGQAVAVSDNTAMIGANNSAWFFDFNTGEELGQLPRTDETPGDNFGAAMETDGGLAIVGARSHDRAGLTGVGSAYLYDVSSQQLLRRLVQNDPNSGDGFGTAVAIEGTIAVVGAPGDDRSGISNAGAVYVFDTQTGVQLHKLIVSGASPSEELGEGVDIVNGIVLAGVNNFSGGSTTAGYLFDASTGQQLRRLSVDGPFRGSIRRFAALSTSHAFVSDGSTDVDGVGSVGSVFVFDINTGDLVNTLLPSAPRTGLFFGRSISVNGRLLAVGSLDIVQSGFINALGAVYLYDVDTLAFLGELETTDRFTGSGSFGSAVAISGKRTLVGASSASIDGLSSAGQAFGYQFEDCNQNSVFDFIDIGSGHSTDCNVNGVPDECEIAANGGVDGVGGSIDCNGNGQIDACEIDGDAALDCDGNGILDECEIALDPNLDCNANGILDACEIALDNALDCDLNGNLDSCEIFSNPDLDCDESGVLDLCELSVANLIDVVVLFDTSGSMDNDAAALCSSVGELEIGLTALNFTASVDVFGINETPGGDFSCLLGSVGANFGNAVPNGGTINSTEDWADAAAVIADRYPWSGDERIVVMISDEGAQDGDPCDATDQAAVDNAIAVARQNGVRLIGVAAGGSSQCVQDLMSDAADATEGRWFLSTDPDADLVQGISDAISDVAFSKDCDGNGVPDTCQIEAMPSLDCDGNGRLDSCELDLDNCNDNDTLDRCEVPGVNGDTGINGPLTADSPIVFTIPAAPPASQPVDFRVELAGDFGALVEIAQLRVNGSVVETFFVGDDAAFECADESSVFEVSMQPADFNALLAGGDLVVELTASPAVSLADCPTGVSRLAFRYFYEGAPSDCNGNGTPDTCDLTIFGGDSPDDNGNFIPDECEGGSPCSPADLVAPFGVTDLDDIDAFVAAFVVGDASVDFVPPVGVVDLDDLDAFVTAFLAGCP